MEEDNGDCMDNFGKGGTGSNEKPVPIGYKEEPMRGDDRKFFRIIPHNVFHILHIYLLPIQGKLSLLHL